MSSKGKNKSGNNFKKQNKNSIKLQNKNYFINIFININKLMSEIKDNEYIKLIQFINKILCEFCKKISRKNFKNRTDYKFYKLNNILYFNNVFFCQNQSNERINIKTDLFDYLINTFSLDSIFLFDKFFIEIENYLTNEKYKLITSDNLYQESIFNESLQILNINNLERVSFKKIKEQYELQKEFAGGNMELKNKINKAFIILRNQYSDYLTKSVTQNSVPQINLIQDLIKDNYINNAEKILEI